MGLLARQLASGSIYGSSPTHPFWYGNVGRQVSSGVQVNHETASNYSAVWAATRLYTETISTLPRVLFKRSGTTKEHALGHPTYKVFRQAPNPEQSGVTFWSQGLNFCINWGDMFAEIVKDGMGRTVQLWPIHHSRIPPQHIVRNDKGELVYHVRNDKGLGTTPILRENILHIPGIMSENGITGKGVIDHAAESIGMGVATERHGASFFGNGAAPSIVMTHPKHLGPEAADNLRRSWNKTYNGPGNSHGLLVLEEGTTLSPLTITPEASQFLEMRQFNVTEIARWYNLPPHLLRELSKSSFNNIESESLHFVLISLMPWLVKLEEECNRQLLTESDQDSGYYFKFMLQGLLRGDMAARSAFYKEMFAMGVYSINDILELEDRNPIGPEGDTRLVPANMFTLQSVYNKDQQPEMPDEDEPVDEPEEQSSDSAETENVQQAALNGAQISALLQMGLQLANGELPKDGTHAMIEGSFPAMDASLIDTIVNDFAAFAEQQEDEPEEQPPMIPPADGDDEPEDEEDNNAEVASTLSSAVKSVLTSTITGLIGYESRKAVRAADKPRDFESWCVEFYENKFSVTFAEQVTPLLEGARPLGVSVDSAEFTATHCERSRSELLRLLDTPINDFAVAVQSTVDGWSERASVEAEAAFSGLGIES